MLFEECFTVKKVFFPAHLTSAVGCFLQQLSKTKIMDKESNMDINQQSHPHQEGQENNTTPQQQGTGQRVSENKSTGMSTMNSGGDNSGQQQKEKEVQQNERQP